MHAIIMAGGEGQRLRPLTCTQPKPLIPVLGKPVMAYTLALAARHAITDVHVTLGYLPEAIEEAFGTGAAYGVRMHYHRERERLGTAGGVRAAAAQIKDTFVVLSGDALTDCDLSAALAFHRERGALATLVLKQCDTPLEYGVVVAGKDGRIERFLEKPGWDEAVSNWVNTGIYILEPQVLAHIPQGRAYDFGRELFPFFVSQHMPVYGYSMQGYWCDVGDVSAYVGACADLLDGRVGLETDLEPDEAGNLIAPDAQVSVHAQLIAPCYIGPRAQIAPGAVLGPHAVIEQEACVARGARIKRSIVQRGARVAEHAALSGAVAADGARMGARAVLLESCVLGEGSVMDEDATLQGGARVWPQKRIEAGSRVCEDVVWGNCLRLHVEDGRLDACSPQEAMQGACAWVRQCKATRVSLMHTGSMQARMLLQAAAAQLSACGVECLLLGSGNAPMLRTQSRLLGTQAAILFEKHALRVLDAQQCLPDRGAQRALEGSRGVLHTAVKPGRCTRIRGAREFYLAHLCAAADQQALVQMQPHVVIACPKKKQAELARALFARLGLVNVRVCKGPKAAVCSYETGFFLDADGQGLTIADSLGAFSAPQMQLLGAIALLERGEREIIVRADAPDALGALCESAGASLRRVAGGAMERALCERREQADYHADALYALLCLMGCFVNARTTPRALLEQRTKAVFMQREIACARTRVARVLGALADELKASFEGGAVQKSLADGSITLYAPPGGTRICITAQARDVETAAELCARVERNVCACTQRLPDVSSSGKEKDKAKNAMQ